MITEKTARALRVILDYQETTGGMGIYPSWFAYKMWPDSEGYKHHHKCGPHGSCQGGMMAMAGGGYLGRLRKRGLTGQQFRNMQYFHFITAQGLLALREWEHAHDKQKSNPHSDEGQ